MAGRLGIVALLAVLLASSAFAASGDRERRAINAADQAWAKRINLSLRDLPRGFTRSRYHTSGPTVLKCNGYAPDLSRFTITGEAMSRDFASADGTAIFSAAEIFRSSSDQRAEWALTARPEALPCLRQALKQAAGGAATTATMRSAPRQGDRTVSFRATISLVAQGVKTTVWLDLIGVAHGRGDATLEVTSVRKPPSAALERRLLAKLASRLHR